MSIDISKFPVFAIPALTLALKLLPPGTPPTLTLLLKALLVLAQQFAPATIAAHGPSHQFGLPPSVALPPEHEWNEAGLAAWAQANVKP